MKRPKPIYLKWRDHYSHKDHWGEADYSESSDGLMCETVGFLMHETKLVYHVAINYCDKKVPESADSVCVIKSCVVKKRYLK